MPNEETETINSTVDPVVPTISIEAPVNVPQDTGVPQDTSGSGEPQGESQANAQANTNTQPSPEPKPTESDPHLDFMLGKITHKELEAKIKPKVEGEEVETNGIEKPPAAPKTVVPGQQAQSTRDYSGLNDDEVKLFKNMSAESYRKMRPIYEQHKKIADREAQIAEREKKAVNAMPKGVFDNEHAYILSPQFKQAHQAAEAFRFESDYWAKQLAAIESGEQWKPLMRDTKTGELFEGKPVDATPQAKADVLRNLTQATHQHSIHQQRLQEVQGGFAQRRNAIVEGVRNYEKQFFHFFEGENNPHKAAIDALLQVIPEDIRDHPLASGYAKAMHTIRLLHENNQKLQAAANMKAKAASDAKLAGPTMSRVNNGAASKPSNGDDFSKLSYDDVLAKFNSRR